ncbi:MAG TPA: SGNH/GDSL hydrolase family protein [Tepidisphaeraceae bacterium]
MSKSISSDTFKDIDRAPGAAGTTTAAVVSVTDANWFFSPYNWRTNGSAWKQTQNNGAYFKISFEGTSATLLVDTSPITNAGQALSGAPKIKWKVNGGPWHIIQINSSRISLVTGLVSGHHVIECFMMCSSQAFDRWSIPANVWRVTGLELDPGCNLLPPPLRTNNLVIFGDSITEGVLAVASGGDDLDVNDSTLAVAPGIAEDFDAEYGQIGFGWQGWDANGGGGVAKFFTDADEGPGAWNHQDANTSRSFSPAPNYVVCIHGANDGIQGKLDATVTAKVKGWLTAVRTALPASRIFLVVPFGGYKRTAITAGFNGYQASASDSDTVLIDLGSAALPYVASPYGDGIHPHAAGNVHLRRLLSEQMSLSINGRPGSSESRAP